MAITKVNKNFLIEGQQAASWLAAQSCQIGIEAPKSYRQNNGDIIYKLSQTLMVVTGEKLATDLRHKWENERPVGTKLHSVNEEQIKVILNPLGEVD